MAFPNALVSLLSHHQPNPASTIALPTSEFTEIEDNINRIRSKSSQLQDRKEQNNEPDIKPRENRDRPIGRNDYRGTKGLYLKKNKITSRR